MQLFLHQPGVQPRWASAENPQGLKGGACRSDDGRKRHPHREDFRPGERHVLAEASGSGMVRRIWITIPERTPRMLRGLRLEMYWDGAATPAVSAPLGDFFGHMLGRMSAFENELFSSPEGRSFCCIVPMPFRSGMRIVVVNEADAAVSMLFYEVDYTLGDAFPEGALYFHSHWRRENPTRLRQDYTLLPRVAGRGRFLGVGIGVIADTATWLKTWWGEGEVKMFLDGDGEHATLCGTGTEDYIGTGWGQGAYAHRFQGCPLADDKAFHYGFYRLHVPDPIFFDRELRVTIQQIGCFGPETIAQLHGLGRRLELGTAALDMAAAVQARRFGLFERCDDWSSCAYFYLDRPENGLPAILPLADRLIAG